MAKGKKTGGRAAGTPNKSTAAAKKFVARVEKKLAARRIEGYGSLEECGVTLLTCGVAPVIAGVWKTLMEYKYGKPAQAIVGGEEGSQPVRIVVDTPRPKRG